MRRQTKPQGLADRWTVRPLDIDPFQLPARFALPVQSITGLRAAARDHIRIDANSVAVERAAGEGPMSVERHSFDAFSGIAIRMDGASGTDADFAISVNLHHDDPDLCIPLHVAFDMDDAGARWQSWARALNLPLLLPAADGGWREPAEAPGKLTLKRAIPRAPRRALAKRRSRMSAVREAGQSGPTATLSGAEIIARN